MVYEIAALYHFADWPDFADWRERLLEAGTQRRLCGSLLLASEGINGTLAGESQALRELLDVIRSIPPLASLTAKFSHSRFPPFRRLKVRLKEEIVRLGVPGINPREKVGHYIAPEAWNDLIADPEVVLIDTRNHYEVELGRFPGARDPKTADFREFPAYVAAHLDPAQHPKVAMYCTGGIRCEKATSYLLEAGFRDVYHLQGGILAYLAKIDPAESRWEGECYVFDDRVSVDHHLQPGTYLNCVGCGLPISPEAAASPLYEPGIACPRCAPTLTPEKRARLTERQQQIEAARTQATTPLHPKASALSLLHRHSEVSSVTPI